MSFPWAQPGFLKGGLGAATCAAGVAMHPLPGSPSLGQADHTAAAAARDFLNPRSGKNLAPALLLAPLPPPNSSLLPSPLTPVGAGRGDLPRVAAVPVALALLQLGLLEELRPVCGSGSSGGQVPTPPAPESAPGLVGNTLGALLPLSPADPSTLPYTAQPEQGGSSSGVRIFTSAGDSSR